MTTHDDATFSAESGRAGTPGQATGDQPAFTYQGVARKFATPDGEIFTAVQDIDLTVNEGEFVSIIGPSGCGKSTLLNMGAGLLKPSRGSVLCRGRPITAANTDVGYMMQQDHLLPWRSVHRNVALPLEVRGGMDRSERDERVTRTLEMVGLESFAAYYPSQLSGGMRKRVALARTLIYSPSILLMDEPFGALDAMLRLVMQEELLRIWERQRKTVLFVTHDLEEAILLADVLVVFGTQPGRIIHTERVDIPRPRSLTTAKRNATFIDTWERLWTLIEEQLRVRPGTPS